jgi:ABC-2 type transport system ATP-binding protein
VGKTCIEGSNPSDSATLERARPERAFFIPRLRMPMSMNAEDVLVVEGLGKTYANGFEALKRVDLRVRRGEIFALLGPNGAGKTTLISIVCGIVNASRGRVTVDGHDIVRDYRAARARVGLVPQELTTDAFE